MTNNKFLSALHRIERLMQEGGSKKILNVKEAAVYMGISESYLYKLMHQRLIPYSKPFGKVAYFERKRIDEFLLQNPVAVSKFSNTNYFLTSKNKLK